jgi:hypothetical protein
VRKLWSRKGCENRLGGEMENKEVKSRDLEQVGEKEEEQKSMCMKESCDEV